VPKKPPEAARAAPAEEEPGFVKRSYRRALRLLDKVVPGNIYEEEKPRAPERAPEPTPAPETVVATREPTPAAPSDTEEPTTSLAEMESRLLERIEIPAGELQALASNRATVIRDRLAADGRVEAERISITTPAEDPTKDAEATEPRVEFSLN
jgi:hypothetical protein